MLYVYVYMSSIRPLIIIIDSCTSLYFNRPNMTLAVLGNAAHCEEAEKLGIEKYTVDDLKKFNKNKKIIKKFTKK